MGKGLEGKLLKPGSSTKLFVKAGSLFAGFTRLFYIEIDYHFITAGMTLAGKDIALFHFFILKAPVNIHTDFTFQQPGLTGTANSTLTGKRKIRSLF